MTGAAEITLRAPTVADAAAVHGLIARSKPLDLNSTYAYLLLCHHYADTCVVAHQGDRLAGFVSGYVPPRQPDTLFIWQVAVDHSARGSGLGAQMLRHVMERDVTAAARFMHTTISPTNIASRRMFQRFANSVAAPANEDMLFDRTVFGQEDHEEEVLLKIGPFYVAALEKGTNELEDI